MSRITTALVSPARLLADAADRAGLGEPEHGRLARLAGWFGAAARQLGPVDELARTARRGRRVVLARHPTGLLLALVWLPAGTLTPIHDHRTWGVVALLAGSDRYERWEATSATTARLVETRLMTAGETVAFAGPPHDIHRQQASADGALELLLLGRDPRGAARTTYLEEDTR